MAGGAVGFGVGVGVAEAGREVAHRGEVDGLFRRLADQVLELRQGGGFSRTIGVDPALAALVGASDGTLPVGVLIGAIAQLMDASEPDLRAELLPRVRELIDLGLLVVTD